MNENELDQEPATPAQRPLRSRDDERYVRGRETLAAVDGPAGLKVVAQLEASFPEFARYW